MSIFPLVCGSLVVLSAMAGSVLGQVPFVSLEAARPNVIVIVADDLGWGDLGCYGNLDFETPHLDRMAAEGVRFTDFYTTFPACAPSRTSLLTGRYHFRTGMFRNPAPDIEGEIGEVIDQLGIPDEVMLLPEAMWASGYGTSMVGKWHLGHQQRFFPTRHGFEDYLGILYSNDMRPVNLMEGEQVVEFPAVQAELTARYTERALELIERGVSDDRPFFLYLAHAMPHKPLAASEKFYTPDTPDDLYADVIRELDDSVGKILKVVKVAGIDQETAIFFTSDNGPWFGGSTGGLRGMKGSTFEGGIRIPLIGRWPGKFLENHVCGELACLFDLFPTIVRQASPLPPIGDVLDGKDLMPLLTDVGAKSPHSELYSLSGDQLATIRRGKWKLHGRKPGIGNRSGVLAGVDWVDPRGPDGETILAPDQQPLGDQYPGVMDGDPPKELMLFDLDSDPSELKDLAEEFPEVVAELKAALDSMAREVDAARNGN